MITEHFLQYVINEMDLAVGKTFETEKQNPESYNLIPYNMGSFIESMEKAQLVFQALHPSAKRRPSSHFIDVGCGIGTKLLFARRYFDFCYGIDINADLIKIAKNFDSGVSFEVADALKCDYSKFNIIYYYKPIENYDLIRQLEQRIYEQAKSGTIIIEVYPSNGSWTPIIKNGINCQDNVFVKTKNPKTIRRLKEFRDFDAEEWLTKTE